MCKVSLEFCFFRCYVGGNFGKATTATTTYTFTFKYNFSFSGIKQKLKMVVALFFINFPRIYYALRYEGSSNRTTGNEWKNNNSQSLMSCRPWLLSFLFPPGVINTLAIDSKLVNDTLRVLLLMLVSIVWLVLQLVCLGLTNSFSGAWHATPVETYVEILEGRSYWILRRKKANKTSNNVFSMPKKKTMRRGRRRGSGRRLCVVCMSRRPDKLKYDFFLLLLVTKNLQTKKWN